MLEHTSSIFEKSRKIFSRTDPSNGLGRVEMGGDLRWRPFSERERAIGAIGARFRPCREYATDGDTDIA
jgi:hypothetical protein